MDGEPRARGLTSHSNRSMGAGDHSEHELAHGGGHRDSLLKNTNKANPNAALSEAQPVVVNLTEQVTLESLRAHQHKDSNGNPITDPDLSNPTRPRLERPLETIRSFERAIDAGYKRRSAHIPRSDSYTDNSAMASKRNSYYAGESVAWSPRRMAKRPGYDHGRSSYMSAGGGYYAGNGQVGTPRARYGQRLPTDGQSPSGRPYGQVHGYHLSQDTMHTAGSDSTGTGPWTNSTEPSSENSSIENNANGKYLGHNGQNGYGRQPTIDEDGYGALPQPARRPIALGNSGPPPGQLPSAARPEPEKKKGWLKRRFSKKD